MEEDGETYYNFHFIDDGLEE